MDIAFDQILILLIQCIIVAVLLLSFFKLRSIFGLGLLFTALGVFQFLQVFLSAAFYIEIAPNIIVSSGTAVFFTASLFAILLVYIREDALEARKVIYALVIANLALSLIQLTLGWGIDAEEIKNIYNLPKSFYIQQAQVVFTGSLVLLLDAFILIFLYEFISRYISILFLRILFTMLFILALDTFAFSLGVFGFTDTFWSAFVSGLISKSTTAVLYSIIFTVYLLFIDKGLKKSELKAYSYQDIFYSLTYRQKFEKVFEEKEKQKIELQKSEDYNRLLFNYSPIGLALCKMNGELVDVNPAYANIIGRTIQETLKLTYWDITPEKYASLEAMQLKNLEETGSYGPYEKEYIHKNGQLIPVVLSGLIIERGGEEFIMSSVEDITERKLAEAEIKNQVAKWQTTFDSMSDSVSIIDMDGRIRQYNKATLSLFNLDNENLNEKFCYQVVHGKGDHFADCPLLRMKKSKQFESMICQDKDRWLEVTVDPIFNEQKKMIGAVHVVSDITDRKQAENSLMENEQKLTQIIYGSSIATIVIDKEHRITHWNKACEELTSITAKKMLGTQKSWEAFYLKERFILADMILENFSVKEMKLQYNQTLKKSALIKDAYEAEDFFPRLGEKGKWIYFTAAPIKDHNGEIIGAIETLQDITKQKSTQEELIKFTDRLQILHEMDKSILAAKSPKSIASVIIKKLHNFIDYKLATVNNFVAEKKIFERLAVYNTKETSDIIENTILVSIYEVIDLELLKRGEIQIINNLKQLKPRFGFIEKLVSKGINVVVLIPMIAENELIGTLNMAAESINVFSPDKIEIASEIANQLAVSMRQWKLKEEILQYTEELEERVMERTKQLEHSNQELREFAQIVSHDLKAPLRAISQLSYWVSQDYEDKIDEEGQQKLKMLSGRVKRMDDLIEGILLYSRAGKQREKEIPVDLQSLVEDTISLLDPPSSIKIIIENQLPEYSGDPTRLGQLFQNLISNAIKFMDKPKGMVKIGCKQKSGCWEFYISDNGSGIEEKYFDRIFQIFQRLVSRDEQEGTGIGLSLVKRIVQIYGGEIWLKSTYGKGTTFYFTLPYKSILS